MNAEEREHQEQREAAAKKTHANFTITCDKCGGRVVVIDSDFGYSPESGSFGSVYLECKDCSAKTDIHE